MAEKHKCGASTGICGSPTFGTGELDTNGYWDFGCSECARAYEKDHPGDLAWPFETKPRVSKPTKLLIALSPNLSDTQKAFALDAIVKLLDNEPIDAIKVIRAAADLMKPLLEVRSPSGN